MLKTNPPTKQKEHSLRIKDETFKNQSTFIPVFLWIDWTSAPQCLGTQNLFNFLSTKVTKT